MGQELVAEAFAGGCALDDACDVDEAEGGGDDLLGFDEGLDDVEAGVGDGDHADVGLDGGKGVVCGEDVGLGEGVEEGALADVGEPDDTSFHVSVLERVPSGRGEGVDGRSAEGVIEGWRSRGGKSRD